MKKPLTGFEILEKYNWQVPRYTSYPPSPFFTRTPAEARTREMISESNRVGPAHVSLYFHIPFCPRRCLFCGCHTEIGRPGAFIRNYMETLERELDLLLPLIDRTRPVTQIHFGGGTPNAVPRVYLNRLLRKAETALNIVPGAEIAIECDPNLLTVDKVGELAGMGFNRLSIGIQDFDLKVLEAVNRKFPKVAPKELFEVARSAGFSGNNLDLIYGLPFQTRQSFRTAIEKAIDAGPDRISLFPYAHVPWVKGHQSRLQWFPMAGPKERLKIAWDSREALMAAGFVPIGMDHFARPSDELAVAALGGGLHRNFQGYCTSARAGQVYALGASAIGQLQEGYYQNAKDLDKYLTKVNSGELPFEIAYAMTPRDKAVRKIINGLLCDGKADVLPILKGEGLDRDWQVAYIDGCMAGLAPMIADGLVAIDGDTVCLTDNGHFASRAVASVFDPLLKHSETAEQPRFSKAL